MQNQSAKVTAVNSPPASVPKPPKPRKRSTHPGVWLKWHRDCWYLRWREAGKDRYEATHQTNTERAVKLAELKSRALRIARDRREEDASRVAAGLAPKHDLPAPDRVRIEVVLYAYLYEITKAPGRSIATIENIETPLCNFLKWCQARSLKWLDELTLERLREWYTWLSNRRRRNGKPYKITSINQAVKPVKTALRKYVASAPHLSRDLLANVLPIVPTRSDTAKRLYHVRHAQAQKPDAIRALLTAAEAFDARSRDTGKSVDLLPPCAADFAALILTGMRSAEFTACRVGDVAFLRVDRKAQCIVDVIGKGLRQREVDLHDFTATGPALLRAMISERGADEYLSQCTGAQLRRILRYELPKYGAPRITLHDLRATCASAQLGILGMDIKRCTKRLGHGLAVAEECYLHPPRELRTKVGSVEAALRCEADFQRVARAAAKRAYEANDAQRTRTKPKAAGELARMLERAGVKLPGTKAAA